jgi:plasmid segregation protein ParM
MSSTHTTLPSCGLDIGFFATKYTCGIRTTARGTEIITGHFPSLAPKPVSKAQGGHIYNGFTVQVDGIDHFIGKDSFAFVDATGQMRAATETYSQTPAYKALFLGALAHIAKHLNATGSLTINVMTLGLPLSTVHNQKNHVISMAQGAHQVPSPTDPGKQITVHIKKAQVIGQPQGALLHHTTTLGSTLDKESVLVLDMGGGTFDWYMSDRMTPNFAKSSAIPKGMLACAIAVANQIDPQLANEPGVIDRIDTSLREGYPSVKIMGRDVPLESHIPKADAVAKEAIQEMLTKVGSLNLVDRILLTGGGARMLKRAIDQALPHATYMLLMDDDPVMSNVKGFHRMSEIVQRLS